MLLAATKAGCDSLAAVARFAQDLPSDILRRCGFRAARPPAHSTIHTILSCLDAASLAKAFECFFSGDKRPGHVAVDGKILYGSHRDPEKPLQVLSAFCVRLSAVIGSVRVPHTSNEIGAMMSLLEQMPVRGAVISGDAFLTQRKICKKITRVLLTFLSCGWDRSMLRERETIDGTGGA